MVCRREGIASAKKSPASEEAGYRFQVSGFSFQVLLFAFASLLFLTPCLLLAPRPRTRQAGMPVLRFFYFTFLPAWSMFPALTTRRPDRKSTRLNSSH